ncbi:M24 family metallopeptidase [Halalkalibacillus halophilus]|uniref:M24 family metallopeptidase n=1 Tax=Halalkalibacillus halophilus TaxID=392827 RepID=UPI000419A433|nr:Xaa-Pro peptidase family protein [Halalkalibacillus halophilus]
MQLGDPEISKEKLDQAVQYMKAHDIDTWLILTREGTDPSCPLLISVRSVHLAAVFIRADGAHQVLTSASDYGSYVETGLFNKVIQYESDMEDDFRSLFDSLDIERLALNYSETDHLCDGLTAGLLEWLEDVIGEKRIMNLMLSSEPLLKQIRSIKSPKEIGLIEEAVRLTDEIYERVFEQVMPGMTEIEMGEIFVKEMKQRGVSNGLGNSFDSPMVCCVRNGLAHRRPGHFVVEPGDIVIFDFSLKYVNYVSDIARTIYFLKPGETQAPESIQHAFDTAFKAIHKTIDSMKPGMKGYEVDAVGRQVIEDAGYPTIRHSVGHQVGRDTHDGGTILGPVKKPKRPQVEGELQVGEVYAIEPTLIQDDGLPCMLVEENVVMTEAGTRLLSRPQQKLVLIKPS